MKTNVKSAVYRGYKVSGAEVVKLPIDIAISLVDAGLLHGIDYRQDIIDNTFIVGEKIINYEQGAAYELLKEDFKSNFIRDNSIKKVVKDYFGNAVLPHKEPKFYFGVGVE